MVAMLFRPQCVKNMLSSYVLRHTFVPPSDADMILNRKEQSYSVPKMFHETILQQIKCPLTTPWASFTNMV